MAMREREVLTGLGIAPDDPGIELQRITRPAPTRIGPPMQGDALFECGNIALDQERMCAWVDGHPVRITAKDFHLALYLLSHPGRVLARWQIIDAIWRDRTVLASRTLDAHVSRIRRRLRLRAPLWSLSAVYGCGYRLDRLTPARDLPNR